MADGIDAEAVAVIRDICAVFSDVPRGPLSLHQAMIARYVTTNELAAAAQFDNDRRWQEIPNGDLEAAGEAFYGSDPISWRYFMPAFMVWSLRYFRSNDSFVGDQTIYTFDLSDDHQLRGLTLERFATLSAPQCKAVCHFLRYMARNGDYADAVVAQHALDAYWGKFCEADVPSRLSNR